MPTIKNDARARTFSAYLPSRGVSHCVAVDHGPGVDSLPVAKRLQRAKDDGLGEIRDASFPNLFFDDSATNLRLAGPESDRDRSCKVQTQREKRSREERLLHVPDMLVDDGSTHGSRLSRHRFSFSDNRTSIGQHAHSHGAIVALGPSLRPGPASRGTPSEQRKSIYASPSHRPSWPSAFHGPAVKQILPAKGRIRCFSTQPILDSERQVSGPSIRPPQRPLKALASSAIKQRMRQCMRRMPQAVVVVTATNKKAPQNPFSGATVSSFTTVTFKPQPVVSLNIKLPSATFDAIQASNQFYVNMLKADDRGAQIASQFAKGHHASPFNDTDWQVSEQAARRLENISEDVPPMLYRGHHDSDPVAFHTSCTYLPDKTVYLGDHAVVFGVVERISESRHHPDVGKNSACLAYIDGSYGRVHPLVKHPQKVSKQVGVRENHFDPSLTGQSFSPTPKVAPTLTTQSSSGLTTPLREISRRNHRSGKSLAYAETPSSSRRFGSYTMQKSGSRPPPPQSSRRAQFAPKSAPRPLEALAHSANVDEAVNDGQLSNYRIESPDAGHVAKEKEPVRKIQRSYPRKVILGNIVRKGFVDYPPFRKIVKDQPGRFRKIVNGRSNLGRSDPSIRRVRIDEDDDHKSSSISKQAHGGQNVGGNPFLRSTSPTTDSSSRIRSVDNPNTTGTSGVTGIIEEVLIRKHFARNRQPLLSLAPALRENTSPQFTSEQAADGEAPIKALLYGSGLSIRKHLSAQNLDGQPRPAFRHHFSPKLQPFRNNIEKAIRGTPDDRPDDEKADRNMPLQQDQEREKLTITEAMRGDIADVMAEIQEYFRTKSKTQAGDILIQER